MQLFNSLFSGYQPLDGRRNRRYLLSGSTVLPKIALIFTFLILYTLAYLYAYSHFFRDPTSRFFDPVRGYDKAYSIEREAEADDFIKRNNFTQGAPRTRLAPKGDAQLCVGVATIARPKIQYITKTVGSLLHGMLKEQRDQLHLILFIAHSNLSDHPIHQDPWTVNLPDTLLDYQRNDTELISRLKGWEETGNHREKGFYDYTYLLNACKSTGAPYIAMLEGDVLAAPGWLSRSIEAGQFVDQRTGWNAEKQAAGERPDWLYTRMFWTETYLGWNSEEWPTYLMWSLFVGAVITGGLLTLRRYSILSPTFLSNGTLVLIVGVFLPLSIILYFASGRMSVQPPSRGIRRMENFGCCSQGMIFRTEQVPTIVDAIDRRVEGYMDMLLETLASMTNLQRWAIFPSLLQHIGGESSKGDSVADERARMIWNFAFERYGELLHAHRKLW